MAISIVNVEWRDVIPPPPVSSARDLISQAVAAMLAQPVPENTLMTYTCTECGTVIGIRFEDGPVAGDPERREGNATVFTRPSLVASLANSGFTLKSPAQATKEPHDDAAL